MISALLAVIHVQYDWFGILQVFLTGLLFGWVRWRSGSTRSRFVLHGLMNAWATVETIIKLDWLTLSMISETGSHFSGSCSPDRPGRDTRMHRRY